MNHAQAILHSHAVTDHITIGDALKAVTAIVKLVPEILRIARPGTGRHRR